MCCDDTNYTSLANSSVLIQGRALDNCPDSIMSSQIFYTVDRVLSCGVVPSLFLIGAPANILSMIVFYRQGLRDRMNLCLFCLAFTDLMFVAFVFLFSSSCLIGIFLPEKEEFLRWTLILGSLNFVYGFAYSSSCLTVIIAVERCVCVMFPMKAATLISTKTMAIIISMAIFFVQLLCGVYITKENLVTIQDEVTGVYLIVPVFTDLYLRYNFFIIIETIVLSSISFFSFACVLSSALITVVRLHTAQTWRKSASSQTKGQGTLMRMLLAVSCVYILCTAPDIALGMARFSVPEFRAGGSYCHIFWCTHMLRHIINVLNSPLNFFVYLIMSSRFRKELSALYLCKSCMSSKAKVKTSNVTRRP